jgi:hypothetical protein
VVVEKLVVEVVQQHQFHLALLFMQVVVAVVVLD